MMEDILKIKMLCLLCLLSSTALGQIKVDLGNDTTYCIGLYFSDTNNIGTNLRIENGKPPYNFAWECKVKVSQYLTFTASDFLDDTTISNPHFTDWLTWPEWIKFILNLSDSDDNFTRDSIYVRFSTFAYSMIEYRFNLFQGDSVQFDGINYIGGGIPPLKLFWQPTTGLSDPNSLYTWCKPDSSTVYYQVATDSVGCVSNHHLVYRINVLTTELIESDAANMDDPIKPFQIGSWLYYNNPEKKQAFITLYTLNGRKIICIETSNCSFNIGQILLEKGVFVVKVSIENKTGTIKFIN